MTSSVTFPIYVTLAIFAPEVVHLVLGKKWAASIPLLPLFACWALVRSTGSQIGSLLMARGRADLSFKWNIAWLGITPPVIWLGSHYGVAGMAVAMTGLVVAGYWPNWYFLVRPLCGARFGEYALQMLVPLIISIVGGTVGYVCANLFVGDLPRLMTGMILGGLVYIGLSLWFNRIWIEAMKELVAARSIL
jgi:O-antigen/teichoic acid export membrane protein